MNIGEIKKRLMKMKALANAGVGGERANAERLLEELAARHGINLDDLEGDEVEKYVYRFKARLGKVALCWWPIDFVCRLAPNGDIINHCWEKMRGFGKPYPGWKWSYEPVGTVIGKGGAW